MTTLQNTYKQLFDVDAIEANMKKLFDVDAAKEALAKLYDVEAIQENLKKVYDIDAVKDAFAKFTENDAVATAKDAMGEAVEKGVTLNSILVATNTHALSDAVVLQATRTRDTIDSCLELVSSLTQASSAEEISALGKAYSEKAQGAAKDLALDLSGILYNAVESNVSLVKGAVSAERPARKTKPARKPAAGKAITKSAA